MNKTDSERLSSVVEHLGYTVSDKPENADLMLINTCSIRQKAEDKVHGLIGNVRMWRKKNPKLKVGVTGCMVRKSSTRNSKIQDSLLTTHKNLDFVFRIEDLAKLYDLIKEIAPDEQMNEMQDEGTVENYFKINPKYETSFKAYVPIQTGCDKFCTYCIVPFTRGREYSRDFDEILCECKDLVAKGVKEITLVGQTVNTYGISRFDKMTKKFEKYSKYPFVDLLTEIDKLKEKGLKWLRFTSPHPKDFSDELIDAISKLETLCPYIHMPIQSGTDEMLKAMNRNYSVSEYLEIIEKFRQKIPDIAISTDIIVGFSSESEDSFNQTCDLYDKVKWDMCYHAKYSPRKGTYSEKWFKDDIDMKEKTRRWHCLNKLIKKYCFQSMKRFAGTEQEILVDEKKEDGYFYGRNNYNKIIRFKSSRNLIGEFVYVKIIEVKEWLMEGSLI